MKRFVLALLLLATPAMADEISITTPGGLLWGTRDTVPNARAAVLILPGSGPTDRDGNGVNGSTIHADTYKLLAAALHAHGITTLRIDKRGIGKSAPALADETKLLFQQNADDANAWAADLKQRSGLKCVWLAGHSEGALVAEVAAQANHDLCGLVLLEGAGRRAGNVLRAQVSALLDMPGDVRGQVFHDITELEAGRTVPDPPPSLKALFRPSIQPYMISWLALDPAALLAKTKLPVLIVQGTHDLQVTIDDAHRLTAARPDATLLLVPGMNHLLKAAPDDRAGNVATYRDPSLPLAPNVADAVAAFILK